MERGGEIPMDEVEIPEVEAAPPQQEQEQVLQMEHLNGGGGGGGGGELETRDVASLDVEEQQPRAVVPDGEGDGGSAEVVVEDEGESGVAGEGADSFGLEVEDEDEVVDDEGAPRVAALASASGAAEGVGGEEEGEPAVGGLPFVAEDVVEEQEETEDDEPREEELRRGEEGLDVAEEGGVSHGMEAEDEGFTDHEDENLQLPALAPLHSDFVVVEENGEADSLVHFAAIEDEVIADDDVPEGEEEDEEEEEEEAASAFAVEERELTAPASGGRNRGGGRKKRGRPPKTQASRLPTKKKEEEDLCFICFDGGNLVVCDRR